jgi:Xaa-Pro aminopeptidase
MGTRECEYPLLGPSFVSREFDIALKPGMVLGLEPHTYKKGLASASLEDMILITESGYEKLTQTGYLDSLLS